MPVFLQNNILHQTKQVCKLIRAYTRSILIQLFVAASKYSGRTTRLKPYPLISGSVCRNVMIWWRHQMEIFSALLAFCAGNSPVIGEFPLQRPVTRSFDVFFDLRLNKGLSKQWRRWWFDTSQCLLWRNCNKQPLHWRSRFDMCMSAMGNYFNPRYFTIEDW